MADNGKAKPASGGAYTINLDNFSKRLKVFYDHWNGNKSDLWASSDAIAIATPPSSDDLRYLKSSALNVWLLGYEFPETIIVFMQKQIHFLCSQKKANLIGTLKNAAHEAVGADIVLHVKGKNGDGIDLMDDILSAACAQSESDTPVVGHIAKEAPEGKLLETWAEKLSGGSVQLTDVTNGFSELFSVKDATEIICVKKAAYLTSSVMKNFVVPTMEKVIDEERKVSHSSLMDDTEKIILDPLKAKVKLKAENIDICYPPVFQSGGKFDLRPGAASNDDYLYYDPASIIICAIGSRYSNYCSNVARTFLIDATPTQSKAYETLLKAQEAALAACKPGNQMCAVYQAAVAVFEKNAPELLSHLTKSAGTGMGLEFRESGLNLNPKNDRVIKEGMIFNVCLGLNNVQAETNNEKTKQFSLLLADTALVNDKTVEILTNCSKAVKDVAYSFNEDEEDVPKPKQPKFEPNGLEAVPSKATLRSDNQEMSKEEVRRQHQAELARQKNEETARRLAGGGSGSGDGRGPAKASNELVAYKNVNDVPYSRELVIQVDQRNEAILLHTQLAVAHTRLSPRKSQNRGKGVPAERATSTCPAAAATGDLARLSPPPPPRSRVPAMASPRSPVGAAGDEAIWRKLREAGFDEESVRRLDKAKLIGYISRIESELNDYQHNLGLILLERKELTSEIEQLKASLLSAEIMHKRERASQQSALGEARKREETLKKNVGVQKECVANLEKALHDMRAETAELKVSYETKSAEALELMDIAQKKFDEAEERLLAAKSLEAESTRARNAALRSLRDMEEREDQLRRNRISSESAYEAKEKEINSQRKSLNDTKKMMHEKEQVLLKEQALLNQRDENILERLAYVTRSEKKLEEDKLILEDQRMVLMEEKNKLDLKMEAVASREEAIARKESVLDKRESELLILQETIADKERVEIERLNQEQEMALENRKSKFETEIENKRLSFEAEMGTKMTLLDQRERALSERELAFAQRERNADLRLAELVSKEEALSGRSDELKEEEGKLLSDREALHIELQKEREEIQKMKLDLEKEKAFFEEVKLEAIHAQQNLAITQAERDNVLTLQMDLKEEIDNLRAQQKELMADADRLQGEKERFEIEWEFIDEKKEELQKEAARIAEERRVITEHLKNQSDIIKQEKENLWAQFKSNSETLSRDHEELMSKMQLEHASWLSTIQREREDLTRDIDNQRMELLNLAKARQVEIDSKFREREEEFEQKKSKELEYVNSQKETIKSKLEHVALELQKLEDERKEATLEREKREQELSEMKTTIEALNNQREKLQEQRKLLHSDREAITEQIQQLNVLEELKIDSESKPLSLIECGKSKMNENGVLPSGENHDATPRNCSPKLLDRKLEVSPSAPTPISWVRKCAQVIFKRSAEKSADHDNVHNGVPRNLPKPVDIANQLGDEAGEVPQVGKKRSYLFACDQIEDLEPSRKYQRSTIKTVVGGEITSNCPSILEEKCSKNVHDDLAFANGKVDESDFADDDEPSEDITVSATEPSNGLLDKQEDDANGEEEEEEEEEDEEEDEEEEEKTSPGKKLWRFLIT